jgi:hypothetical protein
MTGSGGDGRYRIRWWLTPAAPPEPPARAVVATVGLDRKHSATSLRGRPEYWLRGLNSPGRTLHRSSTVVTSATAADCARSGLLLGWEYREPAVLPDGIIE